MIFVMRSYVDVIIGNHVKVSKDRSTSIVPLIPPKVETSLQNDLILGAVEVEAVGGKYGDIEMEKPLMLYGRISRANLDANHFFAGMLYEVSHHQPQKPERVYIGDVVFPT